VVSQSGKSGGGVARGVGRPVECRTIPKYRQHMRKTHSLSYALKIHILCLYDARWDTASIEFEKFTRAQCAEVIHVCKCMNCVYTKITFYLYC